MKPKVTSQRQHLVSNQILTYIKVIVLLRQILSRLLHGYGHILVIIHLWIIVGCICNYIIFNILLYIQVVTPHKDQLLLGNNLIKRDPDCNREHEKNVKQDSKYLQPRWCPSGLSHTQKRRLQRMHKKETMEQQVEAVPKTSAIMKKVWRPKQVASIST